MAAVIFHLPTLVLNHTATLLYPLYASYKAVTAHSRKSSSVSSYNWSVHAPSGPPPPAAGGAAGDAGTELAEMEHWLIYWSIFACLALVEGTFGWLWRWLPFYWEIRLLFNLWLVLPQTRGATWLYVNHLHPFLQGQEETIDRIIDDAKARLMHEGRGLLGKVWSGALAAQDGGGGGAGAAPGNPQQQHGGGLGGWIAGAAAGNQAQQQPPQAAAPHSGSSNQFSSLLGKLAPYAAAGAASLLSKANANPNATSRSPRAHSTRAAALQTDLDLQTRTLNDLRKAEGIAPEPERTMRRAQALARKRQLEAQLAALNGDEVATPSTSEGSSDEQPTNATPPATPSKSGISSALAAAAAARKRFPSTLGESYDMLDPHTHESPSSTPHLGGGGIASPRVGGGGGERKTSQSGGEKWAGWLGK